jgi:valyl-tRNA synthetase
LRPSSYTLLYAERVLNHSHHYTTATMALNASSHNVTGDKTAETTAPPPAVSADIKKDILGAADAEATGGRENENEKDVGKKEKSAKELEKERKKAEKDAKFKAKKAATQAGGAAKDSVAPAKEKKTKKGKEEELLLPEFVEKTPKGEKKRLQSLDGPFTKAYIPKVVESAWDSWWEAQGFFKPDFANDGNVKPAGHFVIPIPPPNVTGKLHCGHALATALQDVLIRWHRMKGYTVRNLHVRTDVRHTLTSYTII